MSIGSTVCLAAAEGAAASIACLEFLADAGTTPRLGSFEELGGFFVGDRILGLTGSSAGLADLAGSASSA